MRQIEPAAGRLERGEDFPLVRGADAGGRVVAPEADEQRVGVGDVHQGVAPRLVFAAFVFLGGDGVLQRRKVGEIDPGQIRRGVEIGQPVRRAVEPALVLNQIDGRNGAAVNVQVEAVFGKS